MVKFKVGDIVISDRNPTCVQRVIKVKPLKISGKACLDCDPALVCVTIWRLDEQPISAKPNKPSMAYTYRHVTKRELEVAIDRLRDIIKSM